MPELDCSQSIFNSDSLNFCPTKKWKLSNIEKNKTNTHIKSRIQIQFKSYNQETSNGKNYLM